MIDVGLVPVMIREILAENTYRDTAHPGETGTIIVQYLTDPQRGGRGIEFIVWIAY